MPSTKSVDSIRKAIEGISATYKDHFNKQDAVALAEGVFTKDGVVIAPSPEGPVKSGMQAIIERYKSFFKNGFTKMNTRVDQVAQLGDDVAIAWGEYEFIGPTKVAGTWSATYVRDTGTWKCRLLNGIPNSETPAKK